MAKNKSKQKKKHIVRAAKKNKRAPVWVYLKTKNRDLIRGGKRGWRAGKLGKTIRKKLKKEKPKKRTKTVHPPKGGQRKR